MIHPAVLEAKKRGVYFDIGHGQGSFSWTVAELCAEQGFWPDAISTDLHSGNIHGPAYDLPTVMSRFLYLGMPLYDVVRAVTVTPATVIRKEHLIGSLSSGTCRFQGVWSFSLPRSVLFTCLASFPDSFSDSFLGSFPGLFPGSFSGYFLCSFPASFSDSFPGSFPASFPGLFPG